MIIIHLLNSLTVGGIEKVVIDLSNGLENEKNKVYIITLSNSDFTLQPLLNKNIEVISLPYNCNSFKGLIQFWLTGIRKLVKIINRIKPTIVHTHSYYHYFLFLSICLKFAKIKPELFRTVHTSGLFYSSNKIIDRFRRKIETLALKIYPAKYISISKTIFKNNKRFFGKYLIDNRYIPNGIDETKFIKSNKKNELKDFFGFKNSTSIVSYVSRLDVGKNHFCLIDAWEKVINEFPDSQLCLAGDGILNKELKSYAQNKNLLKSVTFLGSIKNVNELLSITDIAVFPSEFEGFPISLLEKMYMKLPVITSDIDIFKEIITDNVDGIICRLKDSGDYASKIILLLKNKTLRETIAENGHITAEKYKISEIVKQTLKYYED